MNRREAFTTATILSLLPLATSSLPTPRLSYQAPHTLNDALISNETAHDLRRAMKAIYPSEVRQEIAQLDRQRGLFYGLVVWSAGLVAVGLKFGAQPEDE